MQIAGDEVLHAVHAFPAAAHPEQTRFQQCAATAQRQVRPDDDVDHAVFVFQGDEDGAFSGGRALALGDQASDMHAAAVAAPLQVAQAQDASLAHLRAQQCHRMLAQAQTDRAVIGQDFFTRARRLEVHRALFRAAR